MGTAGQDILRSAHPKRLSFANETWELEVDRLIRVAGTLYRPNRCRIRGRESILRQLYGVPEHRILAEQAEELFDGPSDQGITRIFEAIEGKWRPGEDNPADQLKLAEEHALLSARVLQLEGEVSALRKFNTTLELRLAKLEARSEAGGGAMTPEQAAMFQQMQEAMQSGGMLGLGGGIEGEVMLGPDGKPLLGPDGKPIPAGAVAEGADADAADADAAAGVPAFEMPTLQEYDDNLVTLLGEELGLTSADDEPRITKSWYMCRLIDDEGALVGGMLADLRAVIEQGGLLVMLSEPVRKEMLRSRTPTEDVLEAMSEIFNVQSACINNIDGNTHVRTTPLEPVNMKEDDWVLGARSRMDILDQGNGRCVILAK